MTFEERSHEETERQRRCARSKAWNLAKNMYKLKENGKATFYTLAEEWVLPAASTKEPEEREFVVDSGASMQKVSKRDLNSAELETVRTSRRSTTVMKANAEVQTREEATVRVKELDLFVTVMPLEETPVSDPSALVQHSCTFVVFLRVQTLPNVVHATEVKKEHLVVRTERVAHTHILSRALVINAHALAQGHVDCFNPCAS